MSIPLSLYVHFPWCIKKCPYCDFNSHAVRGRIPERAYVDALIMDFERQLEQVPGRQIESVFMGGGTPSLIQPAQIRRLMNRLRASGQLTRDAEVTLEANPGTLDETYFEDYLDAGVNRLSIGVQSFDNDLLMAIGRIHSAEQAQQAMIRAQQAGFKRINLDVMYGLPGQSVEASASDLECAVASGADHLSVYQLTIEPNTEFAVNTPDLPDSEHIWAMHEQASYLLRTAGFEQYEVSAYTRGAPCRHNVNYWQYGDYLAIGAGAHGKLSGPGEAHKLTIDRYWNHRHPKAYLRAATSGIFSAQTRAVAQGERDLEYLMNALRLRSGFSLDDYAVRTGGEKSTLLAGLAPFFEKNWLLQYEGRIRATEEGFRFLDSILVEYV